VLKLETKSVFCCVKTAQTFALYVPDLKPGVLGSVLVSTPYVQKFAKLVQPNAPNMQPTMLLAKPALKLAKNVLRFVKNLLPPRHRDSS